MAINEFQKSLILRNNELQKVYHKNIDKLKTNEYIGN